MTPQQVNILLYFADEMHVSLLSGGGASPLWWECAAEEIKLDSLESGSTPQFLNWAEGRFRWGLDKPLLGTGESLDLFFKKEGKVLLSFTAYALQTMDWESSEVWKIAFRSNGPWVVEEEALAFLKG